MSLVDISNSDDILCRVEVSSQKQFVRMDSRQTDLKEAWRQSDQS